MPPLLPFYYLCQTFHFEIMEMLRYFYHPDDAASGTMSRYFYHSDHIGSSSWITDGTGQAIHHLHYLPFGEDWVDQRNSSWNAPYTFSGKKKDAETGYGYFGARYYDSGLSIWLSVDPMSDKYPSMSPYNYCANNPVILVDPDGRVIEGVSELSAQRLLSTIQNTFQGDRCAALRNLFQLDGNKMKSIGIDDFNNAIEGLSEDEIALAKAYMTAINASETHYVEMVMSDESLSKTTEIGLPETCRTGADFDKMMKGGGNVNYGNGSYSIIVMDSKAKVTDYVRGNSTFQRKCKPGEILSHELLGHGYSRSHGRTGNSEQHQDAIQMTNLYLRVKGCNFYRNGTGHQSGENLGPTTSQSIPIHY